MSKRDIRYKINQYTSAVGRINSAVSDIDSSNNYNLYKARDGVGNSIGGKAGLNIYNNISNLISSSNSLRSGLGSSSRNINNEIWSLEYEYDNEAE
ncbi:MULTISPECIES: hypothetical protein [Clostridium]|uniref:hypothetical protein n=1 Tax=Clostridium TaxID=1485 RepID=UPI001D96CCF2|nr:MULTISPECIES: hypothetical protein [Clostridium]MBS5308665.1 hypothetical protein [Clostridium sp.]MDB1933150.1 hypothetical protein [Clostridium tertium]MDB1938162.1 hypothetical protein [Clostridium tertium]MDB1944093.1 hypothetical protein [Clostridium tertium]MDB1950743.1 hypothetical protein [Clostridium tertium]